MRVPEPFMTVPEPFMTVPEPCPYGVEVEAMKFHEATLKAQLSISSCNYKKTIVFDKSKQPNFRFALADSDDFFRKSREKIDNDSCFERKNGNLGRN